jgi:hypothetical protein
MRASITLTKWGLAAAVLGVGCYWGSPARATGWLRATTAASEDIAMPEVGARTLAVGGYGINGESDALWVLGQSTDGSGNNFIFNWNKTTEQWVNSGGAALSIGIGRYDNPWVIPASGGVYWWGGAWDLMTGLGAADPRGSIVESEFGTLYFSQGGNHFFLPTADGEAPAPCVDQWTDYGQGTLSPDIEGANGGYRFSIDGADRTGNTVLMLDYNGGLSETTDGGTTWDGCGAPGGDYNAPPMLDVCVYDGTIWGIGAPYPTFGFDGPAANPYHLYKSITGCGSYSSGVTFEEADPNDIVYAITCDVSNGTVYGTLSQDDHYRVFYWTP